MSDDATINKIRRNCVLCTKYGNYRLVLRLCNHCICVSCAIPYLSEWIQNKQKSTFIDCPKQTCQHIIHENDIAALLDISMSDADTIMSDCNRGWLQRHHNRRGILAAFDGKLRSCPNCQNVFVGRAGCNFVQCIECREKFCFKCGEQTDSWQHFVSSTCKFGWDDIWRISYMLRFFLLTDACVLLCIAPIFIIAFLIGIPSCVVFGIPLLVIYRGVYPLFDTSRAVDLTSVQIALILIQTTLEFIVFSLIAVVLSVSAYLFASTLCMMYIGMNVMKCIPPVSRILDILKYASCVFGILGLDNWREMLEDTRKKRVDDMTECSTRGMILVMHNQSFSNVLCSRSLFGVDNCHLIAVTITFCCPHYKNILSG